MGLLKKLLLVSHLLVVNVNNFSITSWNITNLANRNGLSLAVIQPYDDFINSFVFGNPILNVVLGVFSEAFKDCYWCYPPYPCFQIGGPFISPNHPISLPPYPPWLMNMTMELYTRQNPTTPFVFDPNDLTPIIQSNFNNNSETKFLIPGYFTGDGSRFKQNILPALLARSNYNVFIAKWKIGSVTTYEQAVANARMAGAIICRFIQLLKNATGHPLTKIHLIGPSLGAHVCGHVGECLSGQLARISGLDPSGPYYQDTDPVVRLSTSDAKFVDITHTNAGSILALYAGIDQKIGHIDFYPNGGSQQPGCHFTEILLYALFNDLPSLILCHHGRSESLYTESIWNSFNSSCKFTSYACSNYNTFQLGRFGPCRTCGQNGTRCAEMGFNADRYAAAGNPLPAPDKFYLNTNGASPYCRN